MKIGVQNVYATTPEGVIDGYRLLKECGFDAVDAGICRSLPARDINKRVVNELLRGNDKDILALFEPWKKGAEMYGLDNYQAHAIYPSYSLDGLGGAYDDYLIDVLKKNLMVCDYIGCRNLIIHPAFCDYEHRMDPQTEWQLNIDRYAQLIPEAKKYGVTICLENVFVSHRGKIHTACCSDAQEACRYVDTLNSIAGGKTFGFCVDTGHLLLLGIQMKPFISTLGERVVAFHVHDNNGVTDQHLAPYMGVLDWDDFVDALRTIHFDKTLCFETFRIWDTFDHELCPDVMRLIAKTGRMFARRAGV